MLSFFGGSFLHLLSWFVGVPLLQKAPTKKVSAVLHRYFDNMWINFTIIDLMLMFTCYLMGGNAFVQ